MVDITIIDVIMLSDPSPENTFYESVVVVANLENRVAWAFDIDPTAATDIILKVKEYSFVRPLTHAFLANLFKATHIDFKGAKITAADQAQIHFVTDDGKRVAVAATFGDALSLMVHLGQRLVLDNTYAKTAVIPFPAEGQPTGSGIHWAYPYFKQDHDQIAAYWQAYAREQQGMLGIGKVTVEGLIFDANKRLQATARWLGIDNSKVKRDAVRIRILDLALHDDHAALLMMWADSENRGFVMTINYDIALEIIAGWKQEPQPPLSAYQLAANIIKAADITISAVLINALKDEIFYANVVMVSDGKLELVDARPSDAIALALWLDIPIFVTRRVLATTDYPVEKPAGRLMQYQTVLDTYQPIIEKTRQRQRKLSLSRARELVNITLTPPDEST